MTNRKMAQEYLKEAAIRLRTAREALKDDSFAFTVRQSQECLELSLKGALRWVGVEPPKWHDVSDLLLKEQNRFPQDLHPLIPSLAESSRTLRSKRELSFYGDEAGGLAPSELFSKDEAAIALRAAESAFNFFQELLRMGESRGH